MSLSSFSLARPRLTLLAIVAIVLTGLILALDFPSTEEPPITIRTATVLSFMPGAGVDRVEQLVARPIEESIRGMPEVKRIRTTVRPGFAFTYVDLYPTVESEKIPIVWQRLRSRMGDIQSQLPEGTIGPVVDDEFGRVAVMTMGLTGDGYNAGELRAEARRLRDELFRLPGVERVSLHGVRDEQVQIILDVPSLAARGLNPNVIADAVSRRNVIAPAGYVEIGGSEITLNVSGDADNPSQLKSTPIPLPKGGSVPLGALARVERVTQDPPMTGAFVNGTPAVVIAVSMAPGLNVVSFADLLRGDVERLSETLPAGMQLVQITDQAEVVSTQLLRVAKVFLETLAIVMAVVVLFLGMRTGLIVSAIVPTTVLGTMAIMKILNIDLHMISVGAIIIALGLFVDNAIVVAEDMERRLSLGESPDQAAAHAGSTMFVPLLVSSLAIILAFMPLAISSTETGEYLRSLGIVMAIALLLSLVIGVTLIPLLCKYFAHHHAELSRTARAVERLTGWYRGKVRWILGHKAIYIGVMVALLATSGWLFTTVPNELMPPSERHQLQMAIELSPDSSPANTMAVAHQISKVLADEKLVPEISSHALYMGDGGPRFILALNPPTPAGHRAYAVLSLAKGVKHEAAIERLRSVMATHFPDVRVEPKRFSMGSSDAGVATFRISSSDGAHRIAAEKLLRTLQDTPGMVDVSSDAERQVVQLDVDVDQPKAQAAGISSADIAKSMDMLLTGATISRYREGDTVLPVILRGEAALRTDIGQLEALPIQKADGSGSVPLGQVAKLRLAPQLSSIQRVNQTRAVTVLAKSSELTAQGIADKVEPLLSEFRKQGVRVELGGEIEESKSANEGIEKLLPLCLAAMFLLFVWQFESIRKSLIVLASIPFVVIGATLALKLSGTSLTFIGTLGLLALAGIIVNNAILLIDAIDEGQRDGLPPLQAIEEAAAKRLRPIVMTKMVCILGLVPLLLFGGSMWTSMSIVMIGGLALGTLITLGLIPALYAALYRIHPAEEA
ncbi:efflux RND transporter permease subunit [Stenotrophomonas maltophilia]|uniref:efflux RND transporter permease subunit n=1 Tax=Stenotrophomonas maltophilia TaxID=40324 RepID=UPI00066D35F1|nr:efflux RND transporter permease subunit [Stenotrophomonas maltophilia]HEL3169026.1 efflux RND transporter permease subunit [Stenotrophomonas maltophilia]